MRRTSVNSGLGVALLLCAAVSVSFAVCPCTVIGVVDITDPDCEEVELELWVWNFYSEEYELKDSGVYEDGDPFSFGTNGCGMGTQCRLACEGEWVTDAFWTPLECRTTVDLGTVEVEDGCSHGSQPPDP